MLLYCEVHHAKSYNFVKFFILLNIHVGPRSKSDKPLLLGSIKLFLPNVSLSLGERVEGRSERKSLQLRSLRRRRHREDRRRVASTLSCCPCRSHSCSAPVALSEGWSLRLFGLGLWHGPSLIRSIAVAAFFYTSRGAYFEIYRTMAAFSKGSRSTSTTTWPRPRP